ncbi:hypothetical protein [Spirosoma spitsbergense]|uniref:hypothetical protein n=1 Tax=Spirosoma spitsbergense TaxID=431554 RepID=UPI00036F89C1|nr:hypothetical protein [Spirosoma spitsbergense]
MKPFLFFIVLACFSIAKSSAQTGINRPYKDSFNKGNWQVGVRDGRVGGNLIGFRNTLQLHSGYYVANQLAVGLSSTWGREGAGSYAFHDITAGPYLRYQFTATRISPFVDLSYQFGKRLAGEGFTFMNPVIQSAQISPGVSLGVTPFLRAEINYHFQWLSNGNRTEYIGQPQFGLTYLLAKN